MPLAAGRFPDPDPAPRAPAKAACVARLCAAVLLIVPLGGCMVPVFWASPQVHRFGGLDVAAPSEQVFACRVDVSQHDEGSGFLSGRLGLGGGRQRDRYQLTPVPVDDDGRLAPRTLVTWQKRAGTYNVLAEFAGIPFSGSLDQQGVLLRVYRPGFRTIEIQPWQRVGQPDWEPAVDIVAREKAIDDLLSTVGSDTADRITEDLRRASQQADDPGRPDGAYLSAWEEVVREENLGLPADLAERTRFWPLAFRHLAQGTASREHRSALLFAAGEYERLAAQPFADGPPPEEACLRLRAKAAWLRKRADGHQGEAEAGQQVHAPPPAGDQPASAGPPAASANISANSSMGSPTTFDSLPSTM